MNGVVVTVLGVGFVMGLRHALAHAHQEEVHVHFHAHAPGQPEVHHHVHLLGGGLRPFLVGLVHGLAGSAGLALLALSAAPSLKVGLAYLAVFGVGSIAGMLLLSSLMGLPLGYLELRYAA